MRADRLLSMLILLQLRGRVTAQALADEFEVSVRTAYQAAVPIEGVDHAASLLLGFADNVEVLAPPELRAELGRRAARVAALYGKPPCLTAARSSAPTHGRPDP